MPTYEFVDAKGKHYEIFMQMHRAPAVGETMFDEFGRALTRIPSTPQIDPRSDLNGFPYVSTRLPKNLPGCRTTSDGSTIIDTPQHERRVAEQQGRFVDRVNYGKSKKST